MIAVHLALFFVSLVFGVNAVTSKYAMREIHPMALVFIRIVSAAAILYIIQRLWIKEKIQTRRDYFLLAGYSIVGIAINQVLFLKGLALTTAINATVLITTMPAATIGIAILLRKEPPSFRKIIGSMISFSGVILLLGSERIDFSNDYFVGNLLVFLNGISYSFYLVISRDLLKRYHPSTVTTWIFVFGAVGVFPFGIGEISRLDWASVSLTAWACVAFLIIFSSVIVYFINNWALRKTSSSVVAVYIYVQPIVAALISTQMMGETLRMETVIAALLIFGGVFIVTLKMREEMKKEKSNANKEIDLVKESMIMKED
ncbi:MAG TPA: DMT family transporter [bacterium]|nr:DMT family transporter [bacterium]HMW36719.1 DMT family transporter [bacterium]HMZ05274.1 DMT family transporter [bacterium]HNB09995.1 DMT family transporter [bacterium]HNB56001.1 DMT family transporter [bacterium]